MCFIMDVVHPQGDDDDRSSSEVEKAKQDLVKGGLTKEIASKVLEAWRQEAGHEVQADDLRKVNQRASGHRAFCSASSVVAPLRWPGSCHPLRIFLIRDFLMAFLLG